MNEMKIGETQEEIDAGLMLECRQIVKNIVNFGVSESQKIQIINLLSLELESRDAMNIVIDAIKKIKSLDSRVKFSLSNEEKDYNNKTKKLLDL